MNRVGNEQAGFSVSCDPARGRVETTAWGFWSVEVSSSFAAKVIAGIREHPGPKELVLDARELKPMREEGQRSLANLLRALPGLDVTRLLIVTASQLMKLQLVRITTESGCVTEVQWLTEILEAARSA